MTKPVFGSWIIVTETGARTISDRGLVTEVITDVLEGLEVDDEPTTRERVRVVFEDEPDGVLLPMEQVTTDMQWLPPAEQHALDLLSGLLKMHYNSTRPKRDRVAREAYDIIAEALSGVEKS